MRPVAHGPDVPVLQLLATLGEMSSSESDVNEDDCDFQVPSDYATHNFSLSLSLMIS